MEQKKTLWIIAAVGLFLLVVLGAAMILYPPSARTAPAVASITPVEHKTETVKLPQKEEKHPATEGFEQLPENPSFGFEPGLPVPGKENPTLRVGDLYVVSENTTVYDLKKDDEPSNGTTIDLNALRNEVQSQPTVSNINITVNVPEQDTKVVQVTPVTVPAAEDVKAESKKTKTEPKPEVSKKDKKSDSKKQSASDSSSKKTEQKVSEPKPVTRFWVQVAAYSNKKTAENARTILDNNKIQSDIFTYQDNKNRLFYRVRVGPYTTKSEAEYWKAKIEKIPDFAKAESYVTSSVD